MADRQMSDLEDQLRAWADELAEQVAPWTPQSTALLDVQRAPGRSRTGRRMVLVAASVALVAAVASVWLLMGPTEDDGLVTDGSELVTVLYERVEYEQDADLDCPGGSIEQAGTFDSAVFEAWGDQESRRWRLRVTYPDGSTYDVIALGDPWYPSATYIRGQARGRSLGCRDDDVGTLVSPGDGSFRSLNPLADLPPDIPGPREGFPDMPAVLTYETLGTKVPGEHSDSRGRPSELWREVITGFSEDRPLVQTSDWFVDPDTGVVTESTFENAVEGIGWARSRHTLTELETTTVTRAVFDLTDYDRSPSDADSSPPFEPGSGGAEAEGATVRTECGQDVELIATALPEGFDADLVRGPMPAEPWEQAEVGSPGHSLGHWSDGATRGIEVENPGSVPAGDGFDHVRSVVVAGEYPGTAVPNVFHTPDPWRVRFEFGDDPACQDWTLIAVNVSVDELVAAARSLQIRLR